MPSNFVTFDLPSRHDLIDQMNDPIRDRSDNAGHWDRENPSPDDAAGDAPFYGGEAFRRADADDGTGDSVCG